jgi:agmatine deiminase
LDFDVKQSDIDKLYAAKNTNGTAYSFVKLPLTQNTVKRTDGIDLGYKGSYVNYYIANNRVLVPNYNDPNDTIANNIIQALYPTRTVVGIDVRNLYENGGMVHCVTQQQPAN